MNDAPELERLQKAWQQRTVDPAVDSCPDSDRIWKALEGSLAEEDLHAVVRHTAVCPACAEMWRLAHEMGAMQAKSAEVIRLEPKASRKMPVLAMAAGLVVLVGLGLIFWQWQSPSPPVSGPGTYEQVKPVKSEEPGAPSSSPKAPSYRANDRLAFKSLVSESRPVSRVACKLSWTAGPAGTRYSVRVTTAEMVQVDRAEDLSSPAYQVSPELLAEFPPGTRLMWQVQAVLPGGERVASPTFFLTLE